MGGNVILKNFLGARPSVPPRIKQTLPTRISSTEARMRTRIHRAEYESAASLHAKVNSSRLRTSESVLDTIGRTPLIPLHRLAEDVPAAVLVKLESLNPGG